MASTPRRGHGDLDHPGAAVIHSLGVGQEVVLRLQLDAGQDARGLCLFNYNFLECLIASAHVAGFPFTLFQYLARRTEFVPFARFVERNSFRCKFDETNDFVLQAAFRR